LYDKNNEIFENNVLMHLMFISLTGQYGIKYALKSLLRADPAIKFICAGIYATIKNLTF
jgi:hypothetical protein